ncbi:ABC transporter permease subunit [Actinomadura sp. 9N407]|uniref:ABC transporter permease subunit n=1 Tax=Actinomadura sp. 9N407 TaxID=3375154 RepID=UPI0037B9D74E
MIWLTWRQFRTQAAVAGAALAVLAITLAITGPSLADEYAAGIAMCSGTGDCTDFASDFFGANQKAFLALVAVVLVLPALIGLFWGAPLIARELEAGTHRLVWNQSVTRSRWLMVKLALIGLAAMAVAGLGSLAVTWWSSPLDGVADSDFVRLSPVMFDARGIVPMGHAAFAFVLGVTIGMVVRRTVPAMAITVALFVAVQVAMPMLVRPHLLPASTSTVVISNSNLRGFMAEGDDAPIQVHVAAPQPRAWVLTNQTVDASGRAVDTVPLTFSSGPCVPAAGPPGEPPEACLAEIKRLGYRQQVSYHADGRFWAFQWVETGVYAGLSIGLAGFCFWWIRRRVS